MPHAPSEAFRAGPPFLATSICQPKNSPWRARLLGSPGNPGQVVFQPLEGCEPNAFHRMMQRLCFGIVWSKVDGDEA